jgi:xanthine/uracil permease
MLVAVVLVLNLGMPEFLEAAAAQALRVPMVATPHHNLATVELAFCGLMVIIMPVEVVEETGQLL